MTTAAFLVAFFSFKPFKNVNDKTIVLLKFIFLILFLFSILFLWLLSKKQESFFNIFFQGGILVIIPPLILGGFLGWSYRLIKK
jgi:hypothetical protein